MLRVTLCSSSQWTANVWFHWPWMRCKEMPFCCFNGLPTNEHHATNKPHFLAKRGEALLQLAAQDTLSTTNLFVFSLFSIFVFGPCTPNGKFDCKASSRQLWTWRMKCRSSACCSTFRRDKIGEERTGILIWFSVRTQEFARVFKWSENARTVRCVLSEFAQPSWSSCLCQFSQQRELSLHSKATTLWVFWICDGNLISSQIKYQQDRGMTREWTEREDGLESD